MRHFGRASSRPCDPAIPCAVHPTAALLQFQIQRGASQPMPAPYPRQHATQGCAIVFGDGPAHQAAEALYWLTPRKALAYSVGLHKVAYIEYYNCSKESSLAFTKTTTTTNSVPALLLPPTYYSTGRLWPPRAVSAPTPRCRFGVAPYIWPQSKTQNDDTSSFLTCFHPQPR